MSLVNPETCFYLTFKFIIHIRVCTNKMLVCKPYVKKINAMSWNFKSVLTCRADVCCVCFWVTFIEAFKLLPWWLIHNDWLHSVTTGQLSVSMRKIIVLYIKGKICNEHTILKLKNVSCCICHDFGRWNYCSQWLENC